MCKRCDVMCFVALQVLALLEVCYAGVNRSDPGAVVGCAGGERGGYESNVPHPLRFCKYVVVQISSSPGRDLSTRFIPARPVWILARESVVA